MTRRNVAASEDNPLWQLLWSERPPRIHVLSDLHLNTAPYRIPADVQFDILVAAGDIGPIQVAVPWLAAIGTPVIYVLGNHEFFGHDVFEVAEEARALAKGTRVHVLEQDAVAIQGVRFLGATLWTDFGNWDPTLVRAAYAQVQDYRYIRVAPSYRQSDRAAALGRGATLAQLALETGENKERFSPAVAYRIHHDTVSWLEHELCKPFDGPTVVVTHHAPSRACLTEFGVDQELLNPANWPRMRRHRDMVRVAAYASPLEPLLARHREKIAAWVHGHLHMHADFLVEGVRVVANARGYAHHQPEGSAADASEVESGAVDSAIAVGRCEQEIDTFTAECRKFDRHYVVDLMTGFQPPLQHAVAEWLEVSAELIDDCKKLIPHVNHNHDVLRYAVRRCFAENLCSAEKGLDAVLSDQASAIDKHIGRHIARLSTPSPLPSLDALCDAPVDASAERLYARATILIEAWREWCEQLPFAATRELSHWCRAALLSVDYMKARGVQVDVLRPAWRAMFDLGEISCITLITDEEPKSVALPALESHLAANGFGRFIPVLVSKTALEPEDRSRFISEAALKAILSEG